MANIFKTYPGEISDEAAKNQLKLAKKQGDAYAATVKEMVENEADGGRLKEADDYIVGYAVEEAEGMYRWQDGELKWHNPTVENAHIEIVVMDARDKRFIPYLDITVALKTSDGKEVGTHPQPFMWHSWLYHYGRNWVVPMSGTYSLQTTIQPPEFMRHDKANGNRYLRPVTVTFDDVHITIGQKLS